MAAERRVEKVTNLLREVSANILARELSSPDGALVTVTRVTVSEDLYYATIFFSVLGGEPDAESAVLAELTRATGRVQHELNRRLRMRPVPRITFALDQQEKRRERIEKLLGEQPPTS